MDRTTLTDLTLSQLVATHNEAADKVGASHVKKFRDKQTAIKRTMALLEQVPAEPQVPELTAKETLVLRQQFEIGLEQMGGKDGADLKADNMSCTSVEELSERTGLDKATIKGVVGSLAKKNLVDAQVMQDDNSADLWLSDYGIDVAEQLDPVATQKPQPETKAAQQRKTRIMRFKFKPMKEIKHLRNPNTLRGRCVELLSGDGATFEQVEDLVRAYDEEQGKAQKNITRRAYELVRIMHYYLGYGIHHDIDSGVIRIYETE
jgi:DNA-binding MarR family transcriptional regulator